MEKPSHFVVNTYSPDDNRPKPDPNPKNTTGHQSPKTGKEKQEQGENAVDRLSALPDSLCQHIVSFLPATDARRTTFLSRRWRLVFYASPSFDFDEREFHGRRLPPLQQRCRSRRDFIRFVEEALEFRKAYFHDLSIDKFRVSMRFGEEVSRNLDDWISFALERNVKELSVVAEMKDLIAIAEFFQPFRVPYLLPRAVFSTKSIQSLELVFCDLSQLCFSSIKLPFLRNLDMINVHMNDSIFESILSGSPLLEKMNLSLVCGLERIRISGEKLKMLMVFKCLPLEEVVVEAPNLESLLFRGKRHNPDKIDISSCRKLRFLWLQRASNLTDDALQKLIHQNPNLEIMIISHCHSLRNAVINSPKLWMFVLSKCRHLSFVKIEAPSLSAFEYSGHMITFPSVVSSPQLGAVIHIDGPEISSRWYSKLIEMCARFDHCRMLWIRCKHDVDLIIPQEMRKRLLPQLHGLTDLKIQVRSGTMNLSLLEDGIRWMFPGLKNLYIESDGSTHHFQYWGAVENVDDGANWRKCRVFHQT